MTDEQGKIESHNRGLRRLIIVLGIVVLGGCAFVGLCAGGAAYVIVRSTQPVADVGSAFLQAAADRNYDAAFSLLSDGAQDEYGNAEVLGTALREQGIDPQRWTWSSRAVNDEVAEVGSSVVMSDGGSRDVRIQLVWTGTMWLITGWELDAGISVGD